MLALAELELDDGPRAARTARGWIRQHLSQLGHEDLIDSATLAVSELVTNALIHGQPPVLVRLRGQDTASSGPRIEVVDHSPRAPRPQTVAEMAGPDSVPSVGRGLDVVGRCSATWGAEPLPDGAKVIWFEPRPEAEEPDEAIELMEAVEPLTMFDLQELCVDTPLRLCLLDLPLRSFATLATHYAELRREVRLVALAHPERAFEADLAALMDRIEATRAHGDVLEQVHEALARGLDAAPVEISVPSEAPHLMQRLEELVDRVHELIAEDQMLVASLSPHLRALQRWYLAQFQRQSDGLEPTPAPSTAGG